MRKFKKLTAWISRKIKKLAILTCICGFLQYFLAKILKLADYFSAKIKKLTGWIFDKFLIKKLSVSCEFVLLEVRSVVLLMSLCTVMLGNIIGYLDRFVFRMES